MLGGMKQQAPREAFDAVIEFAARPNLSAAEFADLARRLDLVPIDAYRPTMAAVSAAISHSKCRGDDNTIKGFFPPSSFTVRL
jgi:hypothetical protein